MTLLMREHEIREETMEETRAEDIRIFVELLKSFQIPSREVAEKLMEKFDLTAEEVILFLSQE